MSDKKAYLVINARSSAPEKLAEYRNLSLAAVEKFQGRILARGGPTVVFEGDWDPQRLVVVEFPDAELAKQYYDSPEYIAARKAREGISNFDMVLVEGC